MNRRSFLRSAVAAVGGIALEEAIPFGRVWSFPSKIVIRKENRLLTTEEVSRQVLSLLQKNLKLDEAVDAQQLTVRIHRSYKVEPPPTNLWFAFRKAGVPEKYINIPRNVFLGAEAESDWV